MMALHGRLKSHPRFNKTTYQSSGRPVSRFYPNGWSLGDTGIENAHTFDFKSQNFQAIAIDEDNLKLNQIHHFSEGVLGFNDNNLYIIDTTKTTSSPVLSLNRQRLQPPAVISLMMTPM